MIVLKFIIFVRGGRCNDLPRAAQSSLAQLPLARSVPCAVAIALNPEPSVCLQYTVSVAISLWVVCWVRGNEREIECTDTIRYDMVRYDTIRYDTIRYQCTSALDTSTLSNQ